MKHKARDDLLILSHTIRTIHQVIYNPLLIFKTYHNV